MSVKVVVLSHIADLDAGRRISILGLFPSTSNAFGGVQESGVEAWRGIVGRLGERRTKALKYEAGTSKAKIILEAAANRRRPDAVLVWHLHLLKLLPFLRASNSQIVLFLHGVEAWQPSDRVTRFLLGKVSMFISNSDYTWVRFLARNAAFRNVLHRTVHLGIGEPVARTPSKPVSPPSALMIGRLDKGEDYKGHREIIAAWAIVLRVLHEAKLQIIGDGSLRSELEELARRHGVEHAVTFYGQIPESQKQALLTKCHCLVLPSRGEGFGLVYLEAMRVGRPCLVSNLDAGREVVNPPEAGLAADPNNPQEVADALHRMLSQGPEWHQWSRQARVRYEAQFTANHFRQRLIDALLN